MGRAHAWRAPAPLAKLIQIDFKKCPHPKYIHVNCTSTGNRATFHGPGRSATCRPSMSAARPWPARGTKGPGHPSGTLSRLNTPARASSPQRQFHNDGSATRATTVGLSPTGGTTALPCYCSTSNTTARTCRVCVEHVALLRVADRAAVRDGLIGRARNIVDSPIA